MLCSPRGQAARSARLVRLRRRALRCAKCMVHTCSVWTHGECRVSAGSVHMRAGAVRVVPVQPDDAPPDALQDAPELRGVPPGC